jgi:trehalose 6-phosphate synthase
VDEAQTPPGTRTAGRRLAVQVLLAVAVLAVVYLGLLPRLVDVGQVWATLRAMTWLELVTLLAAAAWNLASYLLPQLAALPRLTLGQAALESHASTAVGNLLPAGQAVGMGVTWRFYTSYGFGRSDITLSLLVQGVWNNFVKLGMPIVALGLLVATGDAAGELAPAAVVGVAVFLLALAGFAFGLSSEERAGRLGGALAAGAAALRRLARRPGRPAWDRGAVAFRAQAVSLLGRRWRWLTLATLVSHLSLFLVLLIALRHVGVPETDVSWVEALAAFALVRLLSAFPITPGGLGVVELGLAAALVLAGGEEAPVVAAVLVFRVLTFLLPIPIGGITWWLWRHGRGIRDPSGTADRGERGGQGGDRDRAGPRRPPMTSLPEVADLPVVLVSHRGPVSFGREGSERTLSRGAGGLVTALSGLVADLPDAVWVCAADGEEDAAVAAEHGDRTVAVALAPEPLLLDPDRPDGGEDAKGPRLRLRLVQVGREAHDDFYGVIANPLLWFIQHGLFGLALAPQLTAREHAAWNDGYVAVNQAFADEVVAQVQARGGRALVMIHDYHLYLVADQVRARCPEALISFFLHIPMPGPDAWRVLPPAWRSRLLAGLLGNDVVAFHTEGFARNFLLFAQELGGLPVDLEAMTVTVGDRQVSARHYPISIDVGALRELAASPEVTAHAETLQADFRDGGRQLIVRVDRTDPSKNIVRGFAAFATLLGDHPELVGRVSFLAVLQPSRQDVPEYADYLAEIGAVVARVNATYGSEGYQPVDLRLADDLPLALGAYRVCDVLMVNALADGMNLVAKEAVVVNHGGAVLALSENTGAYQELGALAVTLHPYDIQQQADALHEALTMDPDLRRARRQAAAAVVEEHDIAKWLASQLADLGLDPDQAR